jgi:hypothetical protein
MRLGLKLVAAPSVNLIRSMAEYAIARGEDVDVAFQLVDLDQAGLRYIPAPGAAVLFQILRNTTVLAAPSNTRTTADYSINRPAMSPFSGDASIWVCSLLGTDTLNLVSGGIRVVVTEGSSKKIASLGAAIRVVDGQDR